PRRISLPTYPFARERYWLEDLDLVPVRDAVPDGLRVEQSLASANGQHAAAGTDTTETFLLLPVWNAVPRRGRDDGPSPGERALIVGGTEHQRTVLRRIYPEANVLDLHEGDEMAAIAARLADLEPLRHILVLAPEHDFVSPADEALIRAQERGVLLVFRL